MTFKEFIIDKVQLFFFLVTMILLAQVILGTAIEPERVLHYKDFTGTFAMAGLCVLPTFVGYSKKEPTFKQMFLRELIQFILVECIMLVLAIFGVESSPEKLLSVAMICVATAVIYIMALLIMWYRQYIESKRLTELLIKMQSLE